MKIEEIQRTGEESALELFYQGIRADATREAYERRLRYILSDVLSDILEGTFEERASQFVRLAKEKPDWTRDLLLCLSKKLRERTDLPKDDSDYLSPGTFGNYFKPIKKILDMNDVAIPWKRI
ncbi:MAG: integrase, partial [Thaumarchaeota archaeon]|nr:integrase [Nitrososphaerota archaeon]